MSMRSPIFAASVVVCLLCAADAQAVGFAEGDVIGGFMVTRITTHPEFQRIDFLGSEGTSEVEITYADEAEPGISTRDYRIQPAPGGRPLPEDLTQALHEALVQMESEPDYVPLVSRMERPEEGGRHGGAWPGPSVAGLHGRRWAVVASLVRSSFPYLGAALAIWFIVILGLRRRSTSQTAA